MAANIVDVTIASRENWASVAHYVEWILRLKKKDLGVVKHAGVYQFPYQFCHLDGMVAMQTQLIKSNIQAFTEVT